MGKLVRIFAGLVLAGVALLVVLGLSAPWSPSGWFELGVTALLAVALLIKEARPRRGLALVAAGLLGILFVVRMVGAGSGMIGMRTLPGNESARWLARLIDEQDPALLGARVVAAQWRLPAVERERLVPAMRDAYVEMRRDDTIFPSPVVETFFMRQGPSSSDTVVIEPRAEPKPGVPMKYAVVFLHGFGGSFTLECWLVARAAREIGALTVCPATDFSGHWRDDRGQRILRATLDYLHGRGIEKVFLAGLSNGAVGATALAPVFRSSLLGMILISGAPASAGDAGLPTLVVHGSDDTMTPAAAARTFVEQNHATYANFAGGHFVLLTQRSETRQVIVDWLMHQTGYKVGK
jgi:pimeloyl-ACP methyl ester carboxylesterase